MSKLFIIWDFDAAIGQINASYPYRYNEQLIYDELDNVEHTLKLASQYDIKMIFAITGFSAEDGLFPFHIQDLIRKIHTEGHEIASHSWRHEWFPHLTAEQAKRSLARSKMILEQCLGEEGCVKGFVPPFSRPYSWYQKGAFSFGDRALGAGFALGSLGALISMAHDAGYSWIRATYRPLIEKFMGKNKNNTLERKWIYHKNLLCFPQNYVGFDEQAVKLLQTGIDAGKDVVICGHPSGLSRNKPGNKEHMNHLKTFLARVSAYQTEGKLQSFLMKDHSI